MKLQMIGFRSENPSSCRIMAGNSSKTPTDSLTVPWSDTVRFVRQLSHDLRNDLNAIELQSAYIGELTQDQELTSEIKRLREVVSGSEFDVATAFQSSRRGYAEYDCLSGR